jgi:transcriptional regulator with XRE-family HTH domain
MENRHRWEPPLSEKNDYDVDVVVESSLAMAQATIQKAMRESKIRNAELAERLDRPRSFISRMLSGSHNLTVKTLARAMAACGYELTWQYQPIQWNWVKEPIVIDVAQSAVAAPAAIALTGYSCTA